MGARAYAEQTQRESTREILARYSRELSTVGHRAPDEYGIIPGPENFYACPIGEPVMCSWPIYMIGDGQRARRVWTRTAVVEPWRPSVPDDRIEVVGGVSLRIPEWWTEEIVLAWLAEAMVTLTKMSSTGIFPKGLGSAHPDVVRSIWEAYENDKAPKTRERPTADEISRYDICMPAWLMFLSEPIDRKIVAGVAMRLNLRAIGRVVGLSHERVRQRYKAAMAVIVQRLNSRGLTQRG